MGMDGKDVEAKDQGWSLTEPDSQVAASGGYSKRMAKWSTLTLALHKAELFRLCWQTYICTMRWTCGSSVWCVPSKKGAVRSSAMRMILWRVSNTGEKPKHLRKS